MSEPVILTSVVEGPSAALSVGGARLNRSQRDPTPGKTEASRGHLHKPQKETKPSSYPSLKALHQPVLAGYGGVGTPGT